MSELSLFLSGTLVFFMVSCAAPGPFLYSAWQAEDDWLKRKKKQRELSPPPRQPAVEPVSVRGSTDHLA